MTLPGQTRLLVILAILAVVTVPSPAQDPITVAPLRPAQLGSTVFDWSRLVAKATESGERREIADQPTVTFKRFAGHVATLKPGASSHPPHRHAQEEFVIVKTGTLDVSINGQSERAGAGSLLFFASNDLHRVTNVGEGPATFFVFNLETAATLSVPADPAVQAVAPGKLGSRVFSWDNLVVKPTKAGERRDIVDSPTTTLVNFEAHVTTLRAGEVAHAAHRHPDEELVIVKEGTLEVTINGQAQQAGPGSIFFYASNDEHGMRNSGAGAATYHVIRAKTTEGAKQE